ncbi:hypothetical protein ACFL35_15990 [Candidatus Riflebacteria bacterium]
MPEKNILYIVHCVDTEGPLYESVDATFERIKNTFGLEFKASQEQLRRLKRGEDLPENLKDRVLEFVSDKRLSYNSTWDKLDKMLNEIMSCDWRNRYCDDFEQDYIFNWFIVDHVGYKTNPRRRALGYNVVFEHYLEKLREFPAVKDALYWHYHPTSFFFEAHKTSNNFSYSNEHLKILSHRIIDHLYFPAAFRPGSHTERSDINLFLEQWIPFDYGNQGMPERMEDKLQKDICEGRFGDWRRATSEWETYHPDLYDYQKKGDMKRFICRCLNVGSRVRPITRNEISRAFKRALEKPTILSVTNHDEREMRDGIDWFMKSVREEQEKYPQVRIRHENAIDAVRKTYPLPSEAPTILKFCWEDKRLLVRADKKIWGPQPFLCFKTRDLRYIYENFDFQEELTWSFVFDQETVELEQLEAIGVATNDNYGNTSVYRLTPDRNLENTMSNFLNCSSFQS